MLPLIDIKDMPAMWYSEHRGTVLTSQDGKCSGSHHKCILYPAEVSLSKTMTPETVLQSLLCKARQVIKKQR